LCNQQPEKIMKAIMMRQGAYAEYAIVAASEIAPKPASADYVTAAAVPLEAR
jgi:NADPH:quinone reductase-like Zn-dependent oxidoreductase